MESYIILALISTLFFGINAIILKTAPKIDSITLALVSLSSATILTLLYWAFLFQEKEITTQGIGYGVLSGVVYSIALILFVVAIKTGKVSIVATINALSAGVAVILAIALLSEKITMIKIGGIILGILAAVLLSV